jgi:hypothetical protein
MRKLRLALLLPVVQLLLAAILLRWGDTTHLRASEDHTPTVRLICWGLNAPALLFRALDPIRLGPTYSWIPTSILGFDIDDICFLVGVAVLWFFIGRAIDKRGSARTTGRRGMVAALVGYTLLLALGGFLLYAGPYDLEHPVSDNPNQPVRGILTLMWSVALLYLSGRGLTKTIRRALRGSGSAHASG